MKLIILKLNLLEALDSVEKAVVNNPNLPILKNIKLDANKSNEIIVTSTNLEIAINHKTSGKVIKEGTIIIPFSVFNSIIRNLPSDKINLEKKEDKLIITADNYEAVLKCENPEEYPIIPVVQVKNIFLKISKSLLKEAFSQTLIATQYSDIRPEINGIFVEYKKNQLVFAGTDSFRLAEKIINTISANQIGVEEKSFIVPLDTVENILKIFSNDGDVEIFVDNNQVLFKTENISIISRLVDGVFPDYRSVIPKETRQEIIVDRNEIINAVKVIKTFSGRANDVVFNLIGKKRILEISSSDITIGENTYRVPVKIKGAEKEISVIFNWKYVMDGFRIFKGKDVSIGINEPDKPVVIRSDYEQNLTYVVMPIRG